MSFWQALRLATRRLRTRPLEATLVVLSIGLGVGSLAAVLSILQGQHEGVGELLAHPRYRALDVVPVDGPSWMSGSGQPVQYIGPAPQAAPAAFLSLDDLETMKRQIPGVQYAYTTQVVLPMPSAPVPSAPVPSTASSATSPPGSPGTPPPSSSAAPPSAAARTGLPMGPPSLGQPVIGTVPDLFAAGGLGFASGGPFTDADVAAANPVAVVGAGLARREFGDQDPIGKSITLGGRTYRVVGVLSPADPDALRNLPLGPSMDSMALVPITAMPGVARSQLDLVRLVAAPGADPLAVVEATKQYLEMEFPGAYTVQSLAGDFLRAQEQAGTMVFLFGALAASAMVVALTTIVNLLMASLLRRQREFGISAAIGASRWVIFAGYLTETGLLGLIGGVLGVGGALGLMAVFTLITGSAPAVTVAVMAEAVALGVVCGMALGAFPALLAAGVRPAEALRE